MNRLNQERLTPVISPIKKYEEKRPPEPLLAGALCVNKLFSKPKDPLAIQVDQFSSESKDSKIKKKFSSYKQEHHIRLNRESKLKVNEEIINYLSGAKYKQYCQSNPKKSIITRVKYVKNETEQIKDASKQIAEINTILENRKTDKNKADKKKNKSINSVENSFNEGQPRKPKGNLLSASHVNHTCAKTLRSRIHNYNSIIENFEKNVRWDEQQKKNKSKFYFSTYTPAKQPFQKVNKNNKTNIQNTLDALNTRMTKSKEKFLSDTFSNKINDTAFKSERISKMEYFKPKRPSPKYKSVKDLKIDENKLRQFEEEVKKRCKFAEDAKETKILYENEIFKKKNQALLSDYYSEANLIKNYNPSNKSNVLKSYTPETNTTRGEENDSRSQNIRDAVTTPRKTSRTPRKTPRFPPIQEDNSRVKSPRNEDAVIIKNNLTPRKNTSLSPRKIILVPETKLNDKSSKTIGLITNFGPQDELQKSIMKSEFLMKEFTVNHEGNLLSKYGRDRNKKSAEIVNWADKFKVKHVRKLPKELNYIMS